MRRKMEGEKKSRPRDPETHVSFGTLGVLGGDH